jgi:glycosyltransferase involved in cell wall biosynthesis
VTHSYDIPTVRFRRPGLATWLVLVVGSALGVWRRTDLYIAYQHAHLLMGTLAVLFALTLIQFAIAMLERPFAVTPAQQARVDRLRVTVNVPVYNEDPLILDRALYALFAQTRLPNRVEVVDDGSTRDYSQIRSYWEQHHPSTVRFSWAWQPNQGKKRAQARTFAADDADIFVTVDSDTALERHALSEGLKPFADRQVQSVAGVELAWNHRENWLTRLNSTRSLIWQMLSCSAQSVFGDVLVNRGTFALYRAPVIRENLRAYVDETFFGRRVDLGDDAALTLFARARGRAVQQPSAIQFAMYPDTLSHHFRQWTRWMRGSTIRTFWRIRYLGMGSYSWWFTVINLWTLLCRDHNGHRLRRTLAAVQVLRGDHRGGLDRLVLRDGCPHVRHHAQRRILDSQARFLPHSARGGGVVGARPATAADIWHRHLPSPGMGHAAHRGGRPGSGPAEDRRPAGRTGRGEIMGVTKAGLGVTAVVMIALVPACSVVSSYPIASQPAPPTQPALPHIGIAALLRGGTSPWINGVTLPYMGELRSWERVTTEHPAVVAIFERFGAAFPVPEIRSALLARAVPLLQLDPGGVSLAAIARGGYDRVLRSYGAAIRSLNDPVFLSFGHEMNGLWYPWGCGQTTPWLFRAAWRHIYTMIKSPQVIWVWTINDVWGGDPCPLRSWYPGAAYVNWIGIDGYLRPPVDTFSSAFSRTLAILHRLAPSKPILLAETGVSWGPLWSQRLQSLYVGARRAGLKGILYFDGQTSNGDYRPQDHPAALAAFRKELRMRS